MNAPPIPLEVVLKEGPVLIPSLRGSGVDAIHTLWNGISASEFFPPNTESAFYVLSLRKPVQHPGEVSGTEAELISALGLLATAWPFSGGSFMVLGTHEVVTSARFESNASTVRAELLKRAGQTSVEASFMASYEVLATYQHAPLRSASAIARAAIDEYSLGKLLQYHQAAWVEYYHSRRTDRSSWFIDLYKVREVLVIISGSEEVARSRLEISRSDWSFFGSILNQNDLRHAEVTGIAPSIPRHDVDRLYDLARRWTAAHLVALGLPVL